MTAAPTGRGTAAGDDLALVLFDMQGTLAFGGAEPFPPSIVALLQRLAPAPSLLLGVATNLSRRELDLVLTNTRAPLRPLLQTLQTRSDALAKPNPAMVLRAMAETGAAAGRTVMIGDSASDMEMARAAAVAAIGVLWSGAEPATLERAGADRLVDQPEAVDAAIVALIGPVDGLKASDG